MNIIYTIRDKEKNEREIYKRKKKNQIKVTYLLRQILQKHNTKKILIFTLKQTCDFQDMTKVALAVKKIQLLIDFNNEIQTFLKSKRKEKHNTKY